MSEGKLHAKLEAVMEAVPVYVHSHGGNPFIEKKVYMLNTKGAEVSIYSKQTFYCVNCGKKLFTEIGWSWYPSCSHECHTELELKRTRSILNKPEPEPVKSPESDLEERQRLS